MSNEWASNYLRSYYGDINLEISPEDRDRLIRMLDATGIGEYHRNPYTGRTESYPIPRKETSPMKELLKKKVGK